MSRSDYGGAIFPDDADRAWILAMLEWLAQQFHMGTPPNVSLARSRKPSRHLSWIFFWTAFQMS